MTSRATWKNLERAIASDLSEALGLKCARNILSGANNRTDSGEPRPGDVVIPPSFGADVLIEAKLRSSFLHHRLFIDAKNDAKKHKLLHTLLFTKQKGEQGYLVVMDRNLFIQLLAIPEVQKVLQKGK